MRVRASLLSILGGSCSTRAVMRCGRDVRGECCRRTCRRGRMCMLTSVAGLRRICSRRCTIGYERCGVGGKGEMQHRRQRWSIPNRSRHQRKGGQRASMPERRSRVASVTSSSTCSDCYSQSSCIQPTSKIGTEQIPSWRRPSRNFPHYGSCMSMVVIPACARIRCEHGTSSTWRWCDDPRPRRRPRRRSPAGRR